jgi:ketosteroid isomerase-like protein
MSEGNVEVVRRAYEAWQRNDLEAVADELVHDDFEWRPYLGAAGVRATPYYGPAGLLAYRREVEEALGTLDVEVLALDAFDDHVLAHIRTTGRGAASGIELSLETFHLWTLREGKGIRLATYESRVEALEAAGLPE